MKIAAVLSGEVIDSITLKIPERKKLQKNLEDLFHRLGGKNPLNLKLPFEVFRGDRFIGIVDTPAESLRVALLIRAYLKSDFYSGQSIDARISIGMGTITYRSPNVAESDGEAFQSSEQLLTGMKKHPNRVEVKSPWKAFDDELNTGLVLLETIVSRWTGPQADIMYLKLLGHTEVTISGMLGITQSAVNQRSTAACWNAVDRFTKRFHQATLEYSK
ncbi:hypothetical protein [Siphonobacter curvatus]|uniref:Uncharacterized protein n=1 Tax=Siphonobacter curvatus TaxID=2094562 RepID=A0A2S7IPZ9_9BACT|nr:hypothetical protein [Siphonobacter curvatus]PQA59756.1 hypothetical protein C5O19_09045 [Siphonobacter curvatus]